MHVSFAEVAMRDGTALITVAHAADKNIAVANER